MGVPVPHATSTAYASLGMIILKCIFLLSLPYSKASRGIPTAPGIKPPSLIMVFRKVLPGLHPELMPFSTLTLLCLPRPYCASLCRGGSPTRSLLASFLPILRFQLKCYLPQRASWPSCYPTLSHFFPDRFVFSYPEGWELWMDPLSTYWLSVSAP